MEHETNRIMNTEPFHTNLRAKMDKYVHTAYRISRNFPREELYGATSQFRRSTLAIVLNYIEGYARIRTKVHKNFLEISYGSLQESKYLLTFCFEEGWITSEDHEITFALAEEIGAMLWKTIERLD